ncbi:sigma-54-dependent Fis family transcriptional regulator [candidate division KSB1 bacterium]|nr:sigma-54-dependent Fis family transcriptional regulator [candidate division KSB1 bacterium]
MFKVLLVDDEVEILRDNCRLIVEMGYECFIAHNGKEALTLIRQEHPDVILTDQKMPVMGGMSLLEELKLIDKTIPVIFFTGYGTVDTAVNAMKSGAFDYLQKPFPPEKLESLLKKAFDYREAILENKDNHEPNGKKIKLEGVIGKSKVIEAITSSVFKVAPTESNIFIYGESGTGKELVARNIHIYSKRKDQPFIPLDCNALPGNLLESEIFGYEKGAFTGADKTKPGVIELADKGTLFLDEIIEMDINLQSKLLRFIQEKSYRRLGGQRTIRVNVRIISATNRNPMEAVKQNKLRHDLYYRLNVVPIYIAPLRERSEDIPLLAKHFINKFNPSLSREIKGITSDALLCLKKYNWPGNVRELQNIIEQAMSLTEQNILDLADLPQNIRDNYEFYIDEKTNGLTFKDAKDKVLKQFGKKYFEDLLKKCEWNISKTAREAGISRSSFYRILDEFNITIPEQKK